MRAFLTLIFALVFPLIPCFAQPFRVELVISTRSITPDDAVQDSIRQVRISTNGFAVLWTYTKAGADKFLNFREAHEDERFWLVVGEYKRELSFAPKTVLPPGITSYAQWKEGWLKRRTDKIFCASETEAQAIVAGLKRKEVVPGSKLPLYQQSQTNRIETGAVPGQPPK